MTSDTLEQLPWQVVYGIGKHDGYQIYIDGSAAAIPQYGAFEVNNGFVMGIDAVANVNKPSSFANASYVWGAVGQPLPGTTKSNSLLPQDVASEPPPPPPPPPDDDSGPGVPPAEVSGAFLTASVSTFTTPVVGDYGRTGTLYFDPLWSTSYLYTVADNFFTSALLPDPIPGGDSEFLVRYGLAGEHTQTLTAGTPLNFTTLVPGGVSWFLLSGVDFDSAPDLSGAPPFVTGLTFAHDGLAVVQIRAALENQSDPSHSVPEPSSLIVMSVLGVVFSVARRRKREERIAA